MKNPDLTKKVMDKVVRFEKKRSTGWLRRYWLLITLLIIGIVINAKIIFEKLIQEDAGYFLGFYLQDREIFQALWQEALVFLWDISPQEWIVSVFVILFIVLMIIIETRKRRLIIRRRLKSISEYKKEAI